MPSFLSKVFGRKKHDDKETSRPVTGFSLLDGKFEAVSPPVSPTAINFLNENANSKGRDAFALFRAKSGPTSTTDHRDDLPHLSLNLPGPKDETHSRVLGVVFEADPDGQIILPDSVIGERRLSPLEALILVRACSQAIATRGLETLGIMHPHWYSASPDIQRKLISLFIQSLAPKSPITTLSPTPTAAVSAFESELNFTRSPHDVAAVLRWGLRHLKLEGKSLGKEQTEWSWYKTFSEEERSSSYSPKAFSETLAPQLPPAHLELLCATLEMISSLAAHAEANSISGSKLSKFLGLWLVSTKRSDEKDNWSTLYARWERAGRILEHLFLARIRDEAVNHRMPTRLLELVRHYPYNKGAPLPTHDDLLPRPRFSTRQYDALFIRIDTEVSDPSKIQQKQHPVRLIAEAFRAEPAPTGGERYGAAWDKIKKTALEATEDFPSPDGYPTLSRIFADETIRFLSLVPADASGKEPSSTFNLFSRKEGQTTRRRSFSLGDQDKKANGFASSNGSSSGHSKVANSGTSAVLPSMPSSAGVMSNDWAQFSTSGFLETTAIVQPLAATLFDQEDVEKTVPILQPSKRRHKTASPPRGRRSFSDNLPAGTSAFAPTADAKLVSKSTMVNVVQLDEAFIDFWSDALLEPISSNWPTFVICKLKTSLAGLEVGDKCIDWIIIEQTFSRPPPQVPHLEITSPESSRRARASSPKPSVKSDLSTSRLSSTFSATRKRFSFLTGRSSFSDEQEKTTKGRVKKGISPKIGEMGEILAEEEETRAVSNKAVDAGKSIGVGIEGTGAVSLAPGVFGAVAVVKGDLEPPGSRSGEKADTTTVVSKPDEITNDATKLLANAKSVEQVDPAPRESAQPSNGHAHREESPLIAPVNHMENVESTKHVLPTQETRHDTEPSVVALESKQHDETANSTGPAAETPNNPEDSMAHDVTQIGSSGLTKTSHADEFVETPEVTDPSSQPPAGARLDMESSNGPTEKSTSS